MMYQKSGSIILYTLMILTVVVFLMQQLVRSSFVHANFMRTMIDRENAEMLALSGVSIAMAQLTLSDKDNAAQQKKSPSEEQKKNPEQRLLERLLPYLNRWHNYELTQKIDGIDGLIRVCISCEDGKINLNEAFNLEKMEFTREYDWIKKLTLQGRFPAGELATRLTEFFKQRKRKLDDISELLAIPGLESLPLFYDPPEPPAKGKRDEANVYHALSDVFTIWPQDNKINLLWLSDSLLGVFGLRRPLARDAEIRKEVFDQFIKSFDKNKIKDWDANWKIIEPLYGAKPKIFPEIKNVFSKDFGPKIFSVVSCGKVGRVEQRILAVIRQEEAKPETQHDRKGKPGEDKGASAKAPGKKFRVLRVYWL
jgi:hypothetical protein